MEATECGAACLAIILRYYGRYVPLIELREACGVSRDGSNAATLKRAAEIYGLEGKGYQMELDALRRWRMPVILFWDFNHFVVLEGFRGKSVAINDPANGPRWIGAEAFSASFTGVVLDLKPGPEFQRGGRIPGAWNLIWTWLRKEWGSVLFCLLAGLLLIGPQLAMPVFTQIYIDEIWGQGFREWLKPILWSMALVIGLQAVGNQLQRLASRNLSRRLDSQGAASFEQHVLSLPEKFFSQRYAGDISQRVLLNREVAEFISDRLLPLVSGLTLLFLYLALTVAYSPLLGGVVCTITALNAIIVSISLRRQRDASLQLQKDTGKAEAVLVAALLDISMVKSTAIESDVLKRYAGHQSRLQKQRLRLTLSQGTLALLPAFLSKINTLSVLVVGFLLVMGGQLTLGMVLAAQQVASGLKTQVDELISFVADLPQMESSILRLQDVMDHPEDSLLQENSRKVVWPNDRKRLSGTIDIIGLGYTFAPVKPPLIQELNLSIQAGQRIAIVGASGSGKSTLARLVAGLLEPSQGEILYDGLPLREVPRAVRVVSIAMVQQDIALYGMSVRENLQLWRPLSEDQMREVCDEVKILDVIQALPDGFDSVLAEGGKDLSGGQRQRLEIARALMRNPSILILDEATSALDAEMERQVDEALRRRACTQLIVAHRLSTIRDADLILVLDKGKVVQEGRHQDLITFPDQPYARLVAEGEIKD
jgi:NHLM bacteriocin system ABC transporter peptidase/ATP-binding protein